MDEYDDSNRAFLQAFMARSSMTLEDAQPVLAAILSVHERRDINPEDITQEHFSHYISAANNAISPFDLEIRSSLRQTIKEQTNADPDGSSSTTTETPPERIYALVNTTSDPLTQLATTYTADEIAFVKRVFDYIFDTNNTRLCEGLAIASSQALKLATAPSSSSANSDRRQSQNPATQATQGGAAQSLNMTRAEHVLGYLVEEGWLEKSRAGFFSLAPRALMELKGWLISTYNDDPERDNSRRGGRIKFCAACKEIITVGQRCGERDCKGRLHDHCLNNFFRMQRTKKCPVCKQDWPFDKFVGERAIAARNQSQSRNVPLSRPSLSSPRAAEVDGADDEDNDDSDEE